MTKKIQKTKTQKLNNLQSEKANYKPKDEAENRNNMRKEERQEAGTGRTRTRGQNRTEQNRTDELTESSQTVYTRLVGIIGHNVAEFNFKNKFTSMLNSTY